MKKTDKKQKKKGSIFPKLLVSYFLFSAVAIVVIFVSLLLQLVTMAGGNVEKMIPSMLVKEDGSLDVLDSVYRAKGWVEKLDEEYQVLEVYGEKQTDTMSYTERELLNAIRIDALEKEYHTFWEPTQNGGYLFIYPQEVMKISFNFELEQVETTTAGMGILLLMVFLLAVDGLLASWYIYNKIRKPLKQMLVGMQRVADGEEHVRLALRAEGEFLEIVEAFNTMNDSLEQEKAEKEKLQKERNQMLLELSHDLKTPLATIKSSAMALAEGVVREEELERYYHTIAAKGDRVNTMADDMFTMLKMESTDYQPEKEEIDLCEMVRQICAEYYEEMSYLNVDIDIPEKRIPIMADRRLLVRTIANLLTNAVKYNQTGTELAIQVLEENDTVSVMVEDDGKEIAKEVQQSMFQPFVRGDKSRRTSGGTGLGLAIARGVARKHGGDVSYEYVERKNRFVLRLPLVED